MTIKKIISFLFVFAFILTTSSIITSEAQAAVIFPNGCSSAIGYSITNGTACNGTANATLAIQGCVSPIGYSITTGTPCSGTTEAISFLGGCSSTYGYSTITSAPCNGTNVATTIYNNQTAPGLPTTGTSGPSLGTILLLLSLGLITIGGIAYTTRRSKLA
jgi:hypothetical protein